MNQIWHIYYATKGIAGSYVDALLRASAIAGVDACAFVSCHYRYKFGKTVKCFFPYTDSIEKRNAFIKILRGLELTLAYLKIIVLAVYSRPIIVIHLIDDLFVTYLFFRACRSVGLKVRITCHDVSSHYAGINKTRAKIMTAADELVVHNDAAAAAIAGLFGEKIKSKIRQYPFPFSAYNEIIAPERQTSARVKLQSQIGTGYYLFLGVVRRSKGIETLINAWQQFNRDKKQRLVIAGKWTDPGEAFRTMAQSDDSIIVIDRYLDDEEFVQFIEDAKLVLLPYHNYAHSAIIHACGVHNGAVVISDIQLFTELLPHYVLTCRQGNVASLAEALKRSDKLSEQDILKLKEQLKTAIEKQNDSLVEDLKMVYGS